MGRCRRVDGPWTHTGLSTVLPALQDPRTWDYFEDNRASNDTWVSVDLNAGFTSVMAGMNQVRGLARMADFEP